MDGVESSYDIIHTGNKNLITPADIGASKAITGITRSGTTFTATHIDGTTSTFTQQDNNTVYTHPTYTAKTGKPTANQSPGFGGTFTVSQITSDGTGHVTGATDRVITIPSTAATQSAAGLMSAADKKKLDGVATGANAYSLPTASSTLGGVKTTSTVTSTSGLTACPIISGVPYYKNTTYSAFVKSGSGAKAGLVPAPSTTAGTTKYLREDGTWAVPPNTNTDTKVTTAANTTTAKGYVTTCASATTGTLQYHTSVYVDHTKGVLFGAAWNDFAEYRISDCQEAGRVICENGDDTLSLATERLQPGANVVSDTFGFAIGETETAKTPIAVSGRVLVYPYEDRNTYKPGDAVCAAPNGTVSKMTREEIREYPERIIGTVSAIPSYETWGEGNVPVNGRIWIKVK